MHFSAFGGWPGRSKKKKKKNQPTFPLSHDSTEFTIWLGNKTQHLPQWDGCIAGSVAQQQNLFPKVQSKVKSSRLSVVESSHKPVDDRSHIPSFSPSSTINIFAAALQIMNPRSSGSQWSMNCIHWGWGRGTLPPPSFAWAPRPWPACQIQAMWSSQIPRLQQLGELDLWLWFFLFSVFFSFFTTIAFRWKETHPLSPLFLFLPTLRSDVVGHYSSLTFNNHSTFSSLETFLWLQRKLRRSTDSVRACVWEDRLKRGQTSNAGWLLKAHVISHPSRRQRPTSAVFLCGCKTTHQRGKYFSCFLFFMLFALEMFMARAFPPSPLAF